MEKLSSATVGGTATCRKGFNGSKPPDTSLLCFTAETANCNANPYRIIGITRLPL